MSDVIYNKADMNDYDDVIDFADLVFSHAHNPHDFPGMLPKLYKKEFFMDGIHYLAREKGRIKALVGAYPLKMEFSNQTLAGRGIGAVPVHPRAPSKGYMKTLMNTAIEDMKKNGIVFSCLGGLRQRYEYFGYTPAGSAYNFTVNESNIRHTLGKDWKTGLELRPVNSEDKNILDQIQAFHELKIARLYRNKDRLFEILSSWKNRVYVITENGNFEGYLVCRPDTHDVTEINVKQLSRLIEVFGLLLRMRKDYGQESINVIVGPHETGKLKVISQFAESFRQSTVYFFNIINFLKFVEPFLNLKASQRAIADGSFTLKINGDNGGCFVLSSKNNKPEITTSTAQPDLVLDSLEATRFLFNPLSPLTNPAIGQSVFLQSLLPLPLFFEKPDGI